jgi:hypothetical protein
LLVTLTAAAAAGEQAEGIAMSLSENEVLSQHRGVGLVDNKKAAAAAAAGEAVAGQHGSVRR